jgi:ligand-binding SRPBCC domain-containing protein
LHEFAETPDGTIVSDCVDYTLPLGPLGRIAHSLIVGRQLKAIFEYRQRAMPKLLGVECKELDAPSITAL